MVLLWKLWKKLLCFFSIKVFMLVCVNSSLVIIFVGLLLMIMILWLFLVMCGNCVVFVLGLSDGYR